MTRLQIILIAFAIVILLGVIVFPIINKRQFKRMPFEQQVRVLMKQANKLIYWKNITDGTKGTLIYIKNKRKILAFPWVLFDGKMLCTRANPFDHWDYPDEHQNLTDDEVQKAREELEKYNKNKAVKLFLQNED